MIDVEQLKAKRADYAKGRDEILKQAERQLAMQDGAIAAVDELLKLLRGEDAPMDVLTAEELETAEFEAV